MPLQNRVSPFGTIEAVPARGTMMGNRGGRLHDAHRRLGRSRWTNRRWIACVLAFKGRHRTIMAPRSYTELFFLDEATALAAGHRPCYECRRADYARFVAAWRIARNLPPGETIGADAMDLVLHESRLSAERRPQRFRERLSHLPDGAIFELADGPGAAALVWRGHVYPWSFEGYGDPIDLGIATEVEVLTPRAIVEVLGAGYVPIVHDSIRAGTTAMLQTAHHDD